MDVTPLVKEGAKIIQGYADGGFRVSGQAFDGSVFVFPDRVIPWDVSGDVKSLVEADFTPLIEVADDIDVVLLGTGKTMAFCDPKLRNVLKEHGLNVECMDTGAACRTYNVLIAEGRRVVAANLAVLS